MQLAENPLGEKTEANKLKAQVKFRQTQREAAMPERENRTLGEARRMARRWLQESTRELGTDRADPTLMSIHFHSFHVLVQYESKDLLAQAVPGSSGCC